MLMRLEECSVDGFAQLLHGNAKGAAKAPFLIGRNFGRKPDTELKLSFALSYQFVLNLSLPSFQLKFGAFEKSAASSVKTFAHPYHQNLKAVAVENKRFLVSVFYATAMFLTYPLEARASSISPSQHTPANRGLRNSGWFLHEEKGSDDDNP